MATTDPSPSPAAADPVASIHAAPPPWQLKGDFYILYYYVSAAQAKQLPAVAFSPLEASSAFGDASLSEPVGGIAMVQIIRYRDTPVGAYDELAILPGMFAWKKRDDDGRVAGGANYKISRIYVSQKQSCYNGRKNWNIPKHLARFDWTDNPDKSVTVRVYPHDTSGDVREAAASDEPFFQATMRSVAYVPSFPFSTAWSDYAGVSTKIILPPLPEGRGSQGETPGTDKWVRISPVISGRAEVVRFDMSQRDEGGQLPADVSENFWPGIGRWQTGMKLTNAVMDIGPPDETWDDVEST